MLVNSDPHKSSIVAQVINEVITSVIQIKVASEPAQSFDPTLIEKNATYLKEFKKPNFLKRSKVSTTTFPEFGIFKDTRKYDSRENVHPPLRSLS